MVLSNLIGNRKTTRELIEQLPEASVESGKAIRIVFHAPLFKDVTGREMNLSLNINAPDGNYSQVIDAVREAGGFWVAYEHQPGSAFIPWPPAAIDVLPAQAK
jgi:hypothetical protein